MAMPHLLDSYENMSIDDAIIMCRDLVEDPEFPTVKKWREAGGKVVGHFQVYFPELMMLSMYPLNRPMYFQ